MLNTNHLDQPQYKKVEKLFKEAIRLLKEQFGARRESTLQLMKNYAYYLYSKSKKEDAARKLWQEIFSIGGGNTAATWFEAINSERQFGDVANTRRMLYMAVNSVTDRPYDVFGALVQFEREEGSLEELDKALEKVNSQAKRIRARPAPAQPPMNSHNNIPSDHQHPTGPTPPGGKKAGKGEGKQRPNRDPVQPIVDRVQPQPTPKPQHAESRKRQAEEALDSMDDGAAGPSQPPKQPRPAFQYSTGLEKNKLFVRNVDFACSEQELRVCGMEGCSGVCDCD